MYILFEENYTHTHTHTHTHTKIRVWETEEPWTIYFPGWQD